jgi:DHA2 family multidrug resistance protein
MHMPAAAGMASTTALGLGAFEAMITQQAAIMAYSNDFLIMTFVSLSAFPLLALIRSAKSATAAAAARGAKDQEAHAAVMD